MLLYLVFFALKVAIPASKSTAPQPLDGLEPCEWPCLAYPAGIKWKDGAMKIGAVSMSLSVKDLAASRAFYETLGFSQMGGDAAHGFLIMKNGDALVGLFQGMFEGNMLTFNPGWDQDAQPLEDFDDVRDIKAAVAAAGHTVEQEQGDAAGPGSFVTRDPDGNVILVDQHR